MKALKIILFIIAVLILLFIVLGFIGPKNFNVSRSIEMDAPVETVYGQISDLAKMAEWDAWKDEMSDLKTTINGSGNEVGSYRRWESNESVGEEWIVELVPNESVETELKFMEPFEATSTGYYDLQEMDKGIVKLTMGFKGENGFVMRALSMIPGQSMEANVAPVFDKGLNNLKSIVDTQVAEQVASRAKIKDSKYAFGLQNLQERTYISKRANVAMADLSTFYANNLPSIHLAIEAAADSIVAGAPCGIFYSKDAAKGTTDMCAAIPVKDSALKIEGYETVRIPSSRAVKLSYVGDYAGLPEAHMAMNDFIKAKGHEQNGPVIEEYVTDPQSQPDPNKWVTNIYYIIK